MIAPTIFDGYESLSRGAADVVMDVVVRAPEASVVAATGETPMGTYRELARRRAEGTLDPSRLWVFQLDDYVGVATGDPRSLLGWTMRSFVEPLGIPRDRVVPLPTDGDLGPACAEYDRSVAAAGGYDLAILGIGANGHVGFNEPPSGPDMPTREVVLSQESIGSSARYWGARERVPPRAVTAGMAQLIGARTVLLIASGARKRAILHRALEGHPTPEVPASLLRRCERLVVLADREAWGGYGQ